MTKTAHEFNISKISVPWLLSVTALLACGQASADDLTLRRVMLSSAGLGYFEYEAQVEGNAKLRLSVGLDQIDDVLKSLVVYDNTGQVGGLSLPGREPLSQIFKNLPFDAAALDSPSALLNALRGAEVSVSGKTSATGRVVSVNAEPRQSTDGRTSTDRQRVTLMTQTGLQQFVLEDASEVQFVDPRLREQISSALMAMAANRAKDTRTLELSSQGRGRRVVRVAYVVSAPLWKVAYRLTLPADAATKTSQVQGWAVLENTSGQDWRDVELTLTSGKAVAFKQALYNSYYADRPEVPVEIVGRLMPAMDFGAMAVADRRYSSPMARPAPAAAPAPAMAMKSSASPQFADSYGAPAIVSRPAEAVMAQDTDTQVVYKFALPVTVGNGRSLSVPIIHSDVDSTRQLVYQAASSTRNPYASVVLRNDQSALLPAGIVTIYERGEQAANFVGDARLTALPVGESRILPFALDQKISVDSSQKQAEETLRAIRVGSLFRLEKAMLQTTAYRIKSSGDREQTLVLEVPRLGGGQLIAPKLEGIEETSTAYRVPVQIKPGQVQTVDVVQCRPISEDYAMYAANSEQLGLWLKGPQLDATTRDTLQALKVLVDALDKTQATDLALHHERERLVSEQGRIRDNLTAAPKGSALQTRYLDALNSTENELKTLTQQRTATEKAQTEARDRLQAFLKQLV